MKVLARFRFISVVLAIILIFPIINVSQADDSIAEMRRKQAEIQAKEKAANAKLEELGKEKKSLATDIAALDIEIQLSEDRLTYIRERLETVEAEHKQTVIELNEAEIEREDHYAALKKRLKYIQENGKIGYYQVLFKSKGFGDFLNRMEYVNDIIAYDQNMYAKLIEIEETIADKKLTIEDQIAETNVLLISQEERHTELSQSQAAKQALMDEIENNEDLYNEQVRLFEEESGNLEKKIKEAQAAAERAAREAARRAAASSGSSRRAQGSTGTGVAPSGQFGWPVPGRYSISSGYVNRIHPISGRREFHTGIDIPAPKGTNILAAEAGTVILSGSNGGYGLCVVIDHGNGVSTLYGHNSALTVSVGDKVSRGQTIAKCGSTGISTGNHCHFEVRINGSPTNPGPYVGL